MDSKLLWSYYFHFQLWKLPHLLLMSLQWNQIHNLLFSLSSLHPKRVATFNRYSVLVFLFLCLPWVIIRAEKWIGYLQSTWPLAREVQTCRTYNLLLLYIWTGLIWKVDNKSIIIMFDVSWLCYQNHIRIAW